MRKLNIRLSALALLLLLLLCGCAGTDDGLISDNTATDTAWQEYPGVSDTVIITTDTGDTVALTTESPVTATDSTDEISRADGNNTEPYTADTSAETQTPERTSSFESKTHSDKKVLVGISGTDNSDDLANYVTAVKKAGCDALILSYVSTADEASKLLDGIDALIMTGGEDIDPSWYGEKKLNSSIKINAARDTSDILIICEAIRRDMPVLCICRGMQILNVACGGTLYQDIPTQVKSSVTHRDPYLHNFAYHTVQTESDSLVRSILGTEAYVNSWHHQSVKTVGANIRVTARASDGIVEAIELTDKNFIVGVQFHPEYYSAQGNKTFLKFFTALADAAS